MNAISNQGCNHLPLNIYMTQLHNEYLNYIGVGEKGLYQRHLLVAIFNKWSALSFVRILACIAFNRCIDMGLGANGSELSYGST